MTWKKDGPEGRETAKTRWRAVPYTRGRGLDLGCGPEKLWPTVHCIGVDSRKDTGMFGIPMNPDLTADVAELPMFAAGAFDWVYSSHTLEHFDYEQVPGILREWQRVLRHGGHLCLYLPDEDSYPRVGEAGANRDHRWNVNFDRVAEAMQKAGGWDLVEFERCCADDEYSLWFVFKKDKNPNKHTQSWKLDKNPQKLKTVCVVRLGAYGDVAQSASVLAQLKKQDYHVTLLATHPASEIVAFDPNIDRILVQGQDQIPIDWLGLYWVWLRNHHDRFVNLTESVEGNLLATEGNIRYEWAPAARHAVMNVNYYELQHRLARVPFEFGFTFHPNADEIEWAKGKREKMRQIGIEKVMVWGLAGSSRTHKLWPYIDAIYGRILHWYPNWGVVTTGDGSCVDLEAGWEGHPKIWRTSGKWTMRQVCTFVDQCADLVVGPETGLLSIAAFYPMPKVVFLSHSTPENLTKHWVNTTSMWAPFTRCPGRGENEAPACHQMHPRFEPACRRHESQGTAQCVAEIKPEWVWNVLQQAMVEGKAPYWQASEVIETP